MYPRKHLLTLITAISVVLTSTAWAGSPEKLIVVGIDFSGSYLNLSRGISIAQNLISKAGPGSCLYVRKVTGESFKDSCALLPAPVCIPALPPRPKSKYNRQAWINFLRARKRVIAIKRQAITSLAKVEHTRSKMTDIYGCVAAASVRFSMNKSVEKHLIIISDMVDNIGRDLTVDISGVNVSVVAFQAGADPRYQRRLQKTWTKVFRRCGATSVKFYPADHDFSLPNRAMKE